MQCHHKPRETPFPVPKDLSALSAKMDLQGLRDRLQDLGLCLVKGQHLSARNLYHLVQKGSDEGTQNKMPASCNMLVRHLLPHLHQEGAFHYVVEALRKLEQPIALRAYAHHLRTLGYPSEALYAFQALGFRPGVFRCARDDLKKYGTDWSRADSVLDCRFPVRSELEQIRESFRSWAAQTAKTENLQLPAPQGALVMAYELRESYDLCVAIAKKGLRGGFFFSKFGMPLIVAETHLKGRWTEKQSVRHKWLGKPDLSLIRGQRVLVVDNDLMSGGTLAEVARQLSLCQPSSLSVALTDPPADSMYRQFLKNIPKAYQKVHLAQDFNPVVLGVATRELLKRFSQ